MPNQDIKPEIDNIDSLNEELMASIDRCRTILGDYRENLAANSNDPQLGELNEDWTQSG